MILLKNCRTCAFEPRDISFLGQRGKIFILQIENTRSKRFHFRGGESGRLFKEEREREFERERVQMGAISSRLVGDDDKNFYRHFLSEFSAGASAGER